MLLRTIVCLPVLVATLAIGAAIPMRAEFKQSKNARLAKTYKNVLYFADWKVYHLADPFSPSLLPADQVSHVLYSFADIASGGSVLVDQEAALGSHACIKSLMALKMKSRGMKTLISIGGWTYTHEKKTLHAAAQTREGRAIFISTTMEYVKNMGFDGVDIDWEYPTNDAEATNYVLLLKELREALDAYSEKFAHGYHFLITIASPAGANGYSQMHMKEMDKYIDSWHLMAYDFSGPWAPATGHMSNLYPSSDPNITPFAADNTIKAYVAAGIPAEKIVLGMPLYGRAFTGTTGLGQAFTPGLSGPTYEPDYQLLPKPGAFEHYDPDLVATWSFDAAKGELVAYQGKEETRAKARYIKEQGLGGSMWWSAGTDKSGNDSLVLNMVKDLGSLDNSTNLLYYPESPYSFIRDAQPVQEKAEEVVKGVMEDITVEIIPVEIKRPEGYSVEEDEEGWSALRALVRLQGLW